MTVTKTTKKSATKKVAATEKESDVVETVAELEPTKKAVLAMKRQLDASGITDQDEALCNVAREAFCNGSPYTLSDLNKGKAGNNR